MVEKPAATRLSTERNSATYMDSVHNNILRCFDSTSNYNFKNIAIHRDMNILRYVCSVFTNYVQKLRNV